MRHQQRGITFLGLIFVGAVFGSLALIGMQVFPTTVEFMAIQKAVKKAAAGSTVAEVRTIFDKAAQIDDISSIKGADLEVTKSGDKVVVNFAYQREMHLAGPAYLLLKYQGSSR
jgi:beta-lactam-binding protein with PASTA domain